MQEEQAGQEDRAGHGPRVSLLPRARPEVSPPPAVPGGSAKVVPQPSGLAAIFGKHRVPQAEREGNGWICGDRGIHGTRIAEITSPVEGCGIPAPVRVTGVAGLALDPPAVIDCTTARTLQRWIRSGLKPAVGRRGGGVVKLHIAASYVCRPRNNRKGARISEHGLGHAVDISEFTLRDGTVRSVAKDYRATRWMHAAYGAACGIFGTTLGPGSDGYHKTHFHFDTAHYRGGPYCR
ncbi:extensin-like domain-containing protein [Acidimangrovimonas sediminis]|uniref:extensin-like domain-containing protein n=1 Tax=Acidimangrovimonas sediminis TaxID=2056283 RepID=UPI0013047D4F|nr:extensin family protein [Acidimangrovimonas sediminis]